MPKLHVERNAGERAEVLVRENEIIVVREIEHECSRTEPQYLYYV